MTRARSTLALILGLAVVVNATAQGQELPSAPADTPLEPRPLRVTALANEGVLLRSGEAAVLIDAFLAEPYSIYGALPAQTLTTLLAAEAPFDGIDLALVSHRHGDHLQADPAARFLRASPATWLVSSPQVIALVAEAQAVLPAVGPSAAGDTAPAAPDDPRAADDAAPRARAEPKAVLPAAGDTMRLGAEGLHVDVLRLSHGTGRFAEIQNLGHVVELGGQRVLHVGDAAMDPRNFAPYALAERELDVALLPFWYFLDPAGRRLVAEHLSARHVIACHIPPEDLDDVRASLARSDPHVIVPTPLDTFEFAPPEPVANDTER